MSTFHEMGFLSDSIDVVIQDFNMSYAEWKKVYYSINKFAFALIHKPTFYSNDKQGLLILSCYYRILTAYQSAYLLTERGSDAEAKALLRILLDTLLVMSAANYHKDFVQRHVLLDEKKRIKMTEDAIEISNDIAAKGGKGFFTNKQITDMQQRIAATIARLDDPTNPKHVPKWRSAIKSEDVAKLAGLEDMHKQMYSYLCQYAHPSPTGMRDNLEVAPDGTIKHFKVGPNHNGAELNMKAAMLMLTTSVEVYSRQFGLDSKTEVKQFNESITLLQYKP